MRKPLPNIARRRKALKRRRALQPVIFPPCVEGRKSDYVFENDAAEKLAMVNESRRQSRLAKLRGLEKKWQEQELDFFRAKAKAYEKIIAEDRKWLEAQRGTQKT